MSKVILISGHAGSGKDTTAKIIQSHLVANGKRKVIITHYADLLKYICKQYLGWNGEKDSYGRDLLQHVGTDLIRRQNPNYWVDFVVQMIKFFDNDWDYVIVPDCRFKNEIARVQEAGIDCVHLRINSNVHGANLSPEQKSHASEVDLDDVIPDYYIENNGSLQDLENSISNWIGEILV